MDQKFRAVFQGGAFVPTEPCFLEEGTSVDLVVYIGSVSPPEITDPHERLELLKRVTARMKANPISAGAPRLSREDLHARR